MVLHVHSSRWGLGGGGQGGGDHGSAVYIFMGVFVCVVWVGEGLSGIMVV